MTPILEVICTSERRHGNQHLRSSIVISCLQFALTLICMHRAWGKVSQLADGCKMKRHGRGEEWSTLEGRSTDRFAIKRPPDLFCTKQTDSLIIRQLSKSKGTFITTSDT